MELSNKEIGDITYPECNNSSSITSGSRSCSSQRNFIRDKSELTLDILLMNTNYYFYILQCNDGTKYYGHTNNLGKRLTEHLKGNVWSTKSKQPVKLVYYEELNSRSEAFNREMQFKNGKTRKETIKKLIDSFSKAKCQGFNSHKQSSGSKGD